MNALILLSRNTKTSQSGFTIIELLTVCVLLAILSTILYSSLSAVLNGRELVSARREVTLLAEHIFSQLSADLVAREAITFENEQSGNANSSGSGFSGFGVRRYMVTENKEKQNADADAIGFVTHTYPLNVLSELKNFGVAEVRYRIEELPASVPTRGRENRFRLVRQVTPAAVEEQEIRKRRSNTTILADSVSDFNLRFLIRGEWKDEFTQSSGRSFPEAIEITLGMRDSNDSEHRFRTAIAVSKRQQ